jgi:hypothetical protein
MSIGISIYSRSGFFLVSRKHAFPYYSRERHRLITTSHLVAHLTPLVSLPQQCLSLGQTQRQIRSETGHHDGPRRGRHLECALWVFDEILAIDRHEELEWGFEWECSGKSSQVF